VQEKDCIEVKNRGSQKEKNVPTQEELGGGDVPDMDIPGTKTHIERLPMKRTIL
jgi:hypothetical protein